MEVVSQSACFGGVQRVVSHRSEVLGCDMRVAVYTPPGVTPDSPVLLFLSGLTCTEQNVITKAGAQRACAAHGLVLVCPDTSPRGPEVADDPAWDLGQGAGFYLTATQPPWSAHYRMDRYVLDELPAVVRPYTESGAWGIAGHSMGGHGALVLALRNPGRFRSVSALAPILQPLDVPWGHKVFSAYLGEDRAEWARWDAASLIAGATERLPLLIDQGDADPFLASQLLSERFLAECRAAGHPVTYRRQPGYDHGYHFVASVIDDHVAHCAAAVSRG
ncbi:MAG: S-formylglutathione hydrolase [Myxococcota bacterium]|jgi:S-formylglutathione hydrolase